ncbi:MAG: aminopeptidase P family protein [Spirochaetales bacterium]|nr:aminopeptidase P family protein [Spirochaetales bacterium]
MAESANFTEQEFRERLGKLRAVLKERQIDLAVLNAAVDLFYYTGSVLPLYLVVPLKKDPFLLARKASGQIRLQVFHIPLEEFSNSRDLTRIFASPGGTPEHIGFNFEASSFATVTRIMGFFDGGKPVDISMDLKYLRMCKSNAEISIQAEAGKIIAGFPGIAKKNFQPGMSELELSLKLEEYFRLHGNEVINTKQEGLPIAYGVCSAGKNSLTGSKFDGICSGRGVSLSMPFGASRDIIEENVPVIMDYAFILNGYHMDMTRMASRGTVSNEVLSAYHAMCEIEDAIIKNLFPGTPWQEIYELSENYAADLGFADIFMGTGSEKVRFVGHGVGLQLDEPPYLAPKNEQLLQANMTIAVEPKVAIPGVGVVGIEDTFLVTDSGARCLTECSREWMVF